MIEYTVHFRKGNRVGTRRYRFEHVFAHNEKEALRLARERHKASDFDAHGFRVCRIDHFEPAENQFASDRLVIDWES
jgi:hypothetical protein